MTAAVRWDWITNNPRCCGPQAAATRPQPDPPTRRTSRLDRRARMGPGRLLGHPGLAGHRYRPAACGTVGHALVRRRPRSTLTVRRATTYDATGAPSRRTPRPTRSAASPSTRPSTFSPSTTSVTSRSPANSATTPPTPPSYSPTSRRTTGPYDPSAVTHRYSRLCAGLGLDSHAASAAVAQPPSASTPPG